MYSNPHRHTPTHSTTISYSSHPSHIIYRPPLSKYFQPAFPVLSSSWRLIMRIGKVTTRIREEGGSVICVHSGGEGQLVKATKYGDLISPNIVALCPCH